MVSDLPFLKRLDGKKKLILDHLYRYRNTPMDPPDHRLSLSKMARILDFTESETSSELKQLMDMALVRSFPIGETRYYSLTTFGTREVEKIVEKRTKKEFSTSKIGIETERKERWKL